MCLNILPECIYVCPQRSEDGVGYHGIGVVIDGGNVCNGN